ncbi:hypothetical protein YSA_01441 [Pseudomonas putida ND6]|uniref:Uncharacterized protein n=1 Tax=Pseudomonas putida ND6 TaxID=231023 RepID=I3UPY4_PSEPU|nr:hypothetical protein YSA_01441 [Pseudomonas putida ND6]
MVQIPSKMFSHTMKMAMKHLASVCSAINYRTSKKLFNKGRRLVLT